MSANGITPVPILPGEAKAVESIISDVYSLLKTSIGKQIKLRQITLAVGDLYRKIDSVQLVKTLWQLDTSVNLNTFYCPQHIIIRKGKQKDRILIDSLDSLDGTGHVVVSGIAGQGKSILLRYLCAKCFIKADKIPVFIELRRVQKGEPLTSQIGRFLEIFEVPFDHDLFETLVSSGRFSFFFDGFDEISKGEEERILHELEYLASIAPNCPIVVSTRPESPAEVSPLFKVVYLDNLRNKEYQTVIQKISESENFATDIISKIENHKGNIAELLCTPLLVTLLVLTYKSYNNDFPEQLSDFYERIFRILLQRHDGTKAGYRRPRRCSINDHQYRHVFDATSFFTKNIDDPFSENILIEAVEKSFKNADLKEDPKNFIDDIVTVTCLILREADEYRYIHTSVHEYFAASFLASKPLENIEKFYRMCSDYDVERKWKMELAFLSEIDKYRYSRFFLVPQLANILGFEEGRLGSKAPVAGISKMKALFSGGFVILGRDIDGIRIKPPTKATHELILNLLNSIFCNKKEILEAA